MKKTLSILTANLILLGSLSSAATYDNNRTERTDTTDKGTYEMQDQRVRTSSNREDTNRNPQDSRYDSVDMDDRFESNKLNKDRMEAKNEYNQNKDRQNQVKSENGNYQKVNDRIYDSRIQSSDLLDARVVSKDNKEVGNITDFEINKNGEIEALYVELEDGFMELFGNTVIRVSYDDFDYQQERGEFRVKEDASREFSNFVASFVEETKDSVDYAADNTEEGLENLVNELKSDKRNGKDMKNVSVNIRNDKVYVRGQVDSERARRNIVDKIENNTRLDVVDKLEVQDNN